MSAAPAMVSIGDEGVLNQEVSTSLSETWIDRDLSWLDFNDRVLAEAADPRNPLLERAKFLAIFTSNLDEFFMKRVAVLRRSATTPGAQLSRSSKSASDSSTASPARPIASATSSCPGSPTRGIHLRTWDQLTPDQQEEAANYFETEVSPAVTPLVFDPEHPFPFLSNLSTSLAFHLLDPVARHLLLRARQSALAWSSSGSRSKRTSRPAKSFSSPCMRSSAATSASSTPAWISPAPLCSASPATPKSKSTTCPKPRCAKWCGSRCASAVTSPSSVSNSPPAPTPGCAKCCASASNSRPPTSTSSRRN